MCPRRCNAEPGENALLGLGHVVTRTLLLSPSLQGAFASSPGRACALLADSEVQATPATTSYVVDQQSCEEW
jgi:hypothetical protein